MPGTALHVLVFSKTAGFRHDSIPAGVTAIERLGADHGFSVFATKDPDVFTDADLAEYEVAVFLSTTGEVLDLDQKDAFERFVHTGGGYVGVHAASDTEHDWAWYGELVGARFRSHPAVQRATVRVEDRTHPATAHLDEHWRRVDEWYDFHAGPPADVRVLASVDESTYEGGGMGADHPVAWCRPFDGGRSFYTALGHTEESFAEPEFLAHLLGGIRYAAGE